jgi:hypothetical protein
MACPELDALTSRAIEIGETNPPAGMELLVSVCLPALRHLASARRDPDLQNGVAQGLWRSMADDDRILATEFGKALDAIVICVSVHE